MSSRSTGISRRRFLAQSAGTVAAFACAPAAAPAAPGPTVAQPKRGGELRIRSTAGPTADGYDPHGPAASTSGSPTDTTFSLMYEGLTELAPDGSIVPVLAESWTVSPDGKTYTFKIRQGVKFHNGRELVAADVKYSFERILIPATQHPLRNQYTIIGSVAAPDPRTAVFSLKDAFAPLLANLTDFRASIVPKEEIDKGNFSFNPIGTGPFRFAQHAVDEFLLFESFKDYWRPEFPRLDRMRFLATSDPAAAMVSLRAGDANYYRDAPAEAFAVISNDPKFDVHVADGQTWSWLYLNDLKVTAFKDVRVRQAVFWALDRKAIANLAWPGLNIPLRGGFLPPSHWAALKEPVYDKQDLAKARQLMREAGYANGLGQKLPIDLSSSSGAGQFPRAAQVVQQQLKEIGIETELVVNRPGFNALNGTFDLNQSGTGGTADPDQNFFTHFMPGGGRNYTKFEDPQVSELLRKARVTMDQTARAKLYQDVQRRVALTGPMANEYIYNKYDIGAKHVKGVIFNGTSKHWREAREIWLDR